MSKQSFELLILGATAASPSVDRNSSAQLLNIAERYCLIDCGEATQIQLRKFKAKFQAIDHVFISHLHGDHFFGLPGLLSSMHLLGRKQALYVYGPENLKKMMDLLFEVSETQLNYPIHWVYTNAKEKNLLFEDEKVEIYSFPLKHRIQCTGFLFSEKKLPRKIDKFLMEKHKLSQADIHLLKNGEDVLNIDGQLILNAEATIDPPKARTYAYCSDTIFDLNVVQYIKDADVLYHESTFLNDMHERAGKTFHSTAQQAATIAKSAQVKHLVLGHFSARYRKIEDFLTEAKTIFEACELATDGKKIKI
ncbi:MAG: ribonuclease Z [Bacteroidota bacterium]